MDIVHPNNGMPASNKYEQTVDTHNSNRSQGNYAEFKKLMPKDYIVHNFS